MMDVHTEHDLLERLDTIARLQDENEKLRAQVRRLETLVSVLQHGVDKWAWQARRDRR